MNTSIRYICVGDTETGGLPNKTRRAFYDVALCEVAFVVIDIVKMSVVDEYTTIVAPYKDGLEYNPQALSVNRLTMEQLQAGKPVQQVYRDLVKLFTKYRNSRAGTVLAGHNFLPFDMPFFVGMFEFCKDNVWDYVTFVEDTMKLGWYRATEQENYKLGTCCRLEGVELVDAHRALTDTRANAELLMKYIEYLRGNGGGFDARAIKSNFRETFELV